VKKHGVKKYLIGDLFESLESQDFQCVGGPLVNNLDYQAIKELLYERLAAPIPPALLRKYDLNPKRLPPPGLGSDTETI
jgi:hypothetical protein